MSDVQQNDQVTQVPAWHALYRDFDSAAKDGRPKCRDVHEYTSLLEKLQREKLAAFDQSYASKQADWRQLTEEMDLDNAGSVRYFLRGDVVAGDLARAEMDQYSKDRDKLDRNMKRRTLHYHIREFAQRVGAPSLAAVGSVPETGQGGTGALKTGTPAAGEVSVSSAGLEVDRSDSASPAEAPTPKTERRLDTDRIKAWMVYEGLTVADLAKELKVSERAVSSLRNSGSCHGYRALNKLASKMEIEDETELYINV